MLYMGYHSRIIYAGKQSEATLQSCDYYTQDSLARRLLLHSSRAGSRVNQEAGEASVSGSPADSSLNCLRRSTILSPESFP